ncbi:MAG: fructosamine kinase family protein, partial [Promethearchaeia archaeon]
WRKLQSRPMPLAPRMQYGGSDDERAGEDEGMLRGGLSDLSLLGAVGKLRAGALTQTRELPKLNRINECFEIQCEKASYLLKINRHLAASQMFQGEEASLQALRFAGMMSPKVLRVGDLPESGGSYMIQEYLHFDVDALAEPEIQRAVGRLIARMHSHHPEQHQHFGFGFATCLGNVPMDNSFCTCWSDFFINQRLRPHMDLVAERFPDEARELILLTPLIVDKARKVIDDENIRPSILHGNLSPLRTGIVKRKRNDEELLHVYLTGPSSFYGDCEFDMAFEDWPLPAARPAFSPFFWKGYYETMPRREGHEKRRQVS